MVKVYFTCPWEDNNNLLNKLKTNTPQNRGIWKNIEGTSDINNLDYLIILDDLHHSLLKLGQSQFLLLIQNLNKIIYFQRENTAFLNNNSWFRKNILNTLEHKYSYEDNYLFTFTPANFLCKTYDELKSMENPEKTKNISAIVSAKNQGVTYQKRKEFLINYSKTYKDSIDIFGKGWNKQILGENYKGELGSYHREHNRNTSKFDGLYPYKYSICLENFPKDKITSEKITDALLSWCMPIYWGTEYTNKYYPKEAFHLIDIDDPNCIEKVKKLSEQPITQENIEGIKEARNLILDKYNIWEQIYQIISDKKTFEQNYKYG